MKIIKTARVAAPIDQAWRVLGPDYARAGDWASSVYVSTARPGRPETPEAPVAGRVCDTSIGPVTETILAYDPRAHRIEYAAHGEKMPGFVRGLVNAWVLTPAGPEATDVRMTFTADIAPPFNVLMGWMMRAQFEGVLKHAIEEFAHFVETGAPHPRKVKADQSKQAAAARAAIAA